MNTLSKLSACCLSSSSKAVEGECIETSGRGSSWVGKVMLYDESVSSDKTTTDSEEDREFLRWPSVEGLDEGTHCGMEDREVRLQSEEFVEELEMWDWGIK